MRATVARPGIAFVSVVVGAPSERLCEPGIGLPCGTGGRVTEQLDELLLDLGRDRVLPAVGLLVGLLPLEPDHVDQEALGEAVPAHDRHRELAALLGEAEGAVAEELGVALLDQTVHLLRDRGRREPEPLDEPGADRDDAFLLDLEDRLEVLLGGVVHLGHG